MVKFENHLGVIDISHDYFINLVGSAVVDCFGVAHRIYILFKFLYLLWIDAGTVIT